jgi:hypothetical protein
LETDSGAGGRSECEARLDCILSLHGPATQAKYVAGNVPGGGKHTVRNKEHCGTERIGNTVAIFKDTDMANHCPIPNPEWLIFFLNQVGHFISIAANI